MGVPRVGVSDLEGVLIICCEARSASVYHGDGDDCGAGASVRGATAERAKDRSSDVQIISPPPG